MTSCKAISNRVGLALPANLSFVTSAKSAGPPPNIQAKISLQDITAEAGLNFQHVSGEAFNKQFLLEATGSGVAIFDYDGDGLEDIFLVSADRWSNPRSAPMPTSRLFRNLGNLKFQDVTESAGLVHRGWGQGACVGDYDNDGREDLLVTYYGHNVLYHNDG